nr:MAG TPA: hypothetical protein [Caudoviricetes sp.]
MIFIHYYQIGANENKKERRAICDTLDDAKAQQRVLGGVIQAFECVENIEQTNELVIDEVSQLIDDLISEELGSPRSMNFTNEQWNEYKHNSLENIKCIMRGEFGENE